MFWNKNKSSKLIQMQILKISIFFVLIIIFSFLGTTNSDHESSEVVDHCQIQVCSYKEPVSRYVQFPFVIKNDSMPWFCGYPGFDLICNENDKLLINLPNLGSFSIEEIDYINQVLWLNDLDNCLPRKLLSINGSSFMGNNSPFNPYLEQDYWFYNCSNDFLNSSDNLNITLIGCLSSTNYGVFASPLDKIVKGNSSLCAKIGPIKVPIGPNKEDYSLNLRSDIRLTWSQPNECAKCYERNGRCKFKRNSNSEVECFNLPNHGLTRQAIIAIALAFATPLVLVTLCMLYFIFKAVNQRRGIVGATLALAESDGPQPQTVVQGLNRDIIESYPKVVLGESRRLPKADDMYCPICLGEYMPKESLRTIPDCGHCFHVDCIDEWLQLNASCPVCRNSPSKTTQNND
ncbi:putative RING-H2 finger protein ATL21A [Chenopodium quinoa]|nr:putative RING-H2 finger protein ATL21A [Chenopodium quinoa]